MVSCDVIRCRYLFFFFNDTATTEIYTLSLHDALPISRALPHDAGLGALRRSQQGGSALRGALPGRDGGRHDPRSLARPLRRSEEHTSELQSLAYLVCRLLLEKKK